MNTVSLSPWLFSQPPPLVRSLESAFLANVANGLSSSAFLSPSSKSEIASMIERKSPAREVGDVLFMAHARQWVTDISARFGEKSVRSSWHGSERLLRPFGSRAKAEGRDVLEVSCKPDLLANDASDALTGGLGLIHMGLDGAGYYGLKYPATNRSRVVLRIASPSVLESQLVRLFGPKAARFCMTEGEIDPRQNNDLHKLGYHALGNPMAEGRVHAFYSSPLGFAIHDEGHAALWSAYTPPPMRLAACLVFEAADETFSMRNKEKFESDLDSLQDLNLTIDGSVRAIMEKWRDRIPAGTFRKTIRRFLEKWDNACDEVGRNEELESIRRQAVDLVA